MVRATERKQFFFEKNTKKLLSVQGATLAVVSHSGNQSSKSFLFLFFKKEILPCFAAPPRSQSRCAVLKTCIIDAILRQHLQEQAIR
jgi:hypothetical protein